ncbi:GTPase [Terracoccus luteus]|uniref:GTP-binding protein EngB required for normal cell division n=1 Tax=Terracoccus luteus TaxID=53356 RepID=A0A839Q1L3_9MICO|nr:GTPase [Terracoccus luteus]MBB2986962.1 GTP-binding protein EngB required for normal cell division [Terracoccus luteus]MCP2172613.1 GTP-binding protein EngB required for normal cell division [Terracoccus luteus]
MSPIRMGRAKVATVSTADVARRSAALSLALVRGADELDPASVELARRVVDKAARRTTIAGDHTVVALAGATGSGKSSLFNALVGEPVATIGARRPTTSTPTAAIWARATADGSDATELLDWLGVPARHVVATGPDGIRDGGRDTGEALLGTLDGLVLLDLPDFDSRESAHRREAERVLELVDVFVWVTDPQKYADARLHDEFVSALSSHEAVTLAVLNQVDRLPERVVAPLRDDLARLLEADGVASPTVLTASATTGAGVPELRQRLANIVAGQAASRHRLRSDVVGAAGALRRDVADSEPRAEALPRRDLDAALARAAGVPVVLDAVARDYRREAFGHTGWPFTRWTKGLTADPLRRLRLGTRDAVPVDIEGSDVRAVLGRSSIPAPSASATSAVDVATRTFVRGAADGLPVRWAQAVEDSVGTQDPPIADALDQAVLGTSLRARRPVWWLLVDGLQWVLGLAAVAGLLWLAALWVVGLLALPRPDLPSVGVVPVPALMLVGGVLLGLLVGAVSRAAARVGARRRRAVVGRRLDEAVARVGDEHVVAPVARVLDRHRETRERLDEALT